MTALASGACGGGADARLIGVVPKGANHLFWRTVHAGAIKAAQENNLRALWNAPQMEVDSSRQIAIVENLVARRVAGIVLAPVDEEALVSVVERADREGVPVSIFDSDIKTDRIVSFVATDNYRAGEMAGERLGEVLGGRGQVGVIGFMPGSASTMKREQGFLDVMREKFPAVEVVGVRFNMADRAKAMAETENLLTAYPGLTGLFADNESSTDGVVRAVKQRGVAGRVQVVGFDASEELVRELKAGALDSIVVQDPFKMGYESTRALAVHLDGGDPPDRVDSGAYLVTRDNVDTAEMTRLLFPPIEQWLSQS